MANETITTTSVKLKDEMVSELFRKVNDDSAIAHLSSSTPMTFGTTDHMVFTQEPEGEFVAESGAKNPSTAAFSIVPATPHKAQVTVRMSDELQWADEDGRIQIIDGLLNSIEGAMARALDYGVFHAVSPLTGDKVSGMDALVDDANTVVASATNPEENMDEMVKAIQKSGYIPDSVALSVDQALEIYTDRDTDGRKLYPDFKIGNNAQNVYEGFNAFTSGTVNGKLCKTDPEVLAIMGDFSLIKWGIVRDLGIDVIPYGNPDGLGDLKRYNQVAYRAEVVYAWAVLDPKGFAVLKPKA